MNGGLMPLYDLAGNLDNANFGRNTIWEGAVTEGKTFHFSSTRPAGRQFVAEASDLRPIEPDSYDFVLSCHMLEHAANPLKVLLEWKRVLRSGGVLVILVPHRDGTFDHRRPITRLDHIVADFQGDVGEDDLTHLEEVRRLHDLGRDPYAGGRSNFETRVRNNVEHRSLHHHVFNVDLVARLLDYAGFQIDALEAQRPNHIIAVARKPDGPDVANERFFSTAASYRASSPFGSDRPSRQN